MKDLKDANELAPLMGFRAYPARFYILFTFSMLSFFQSTILFHGRPCASNAQV
jgi:hypothetical protein